MKSEVMPLLLKAVSSFAQKWKEHREFYKEDDEGLLYLDLGELACHLVELYRNHQTSECPTIFAVVNRLHFEGDSYVKEAAIIGILEGIQNVAINQGVDPEKFISYLSIESLKHWRDLNEFWQGR